MIDVCGEVVDVEGKEENVWEATKQNRKDYSSISSGDRRDVGDIIAIAGGAVSSEKSQQ